jgi:sulfur carrier protein
MPITLTINGEAHALEAPVSVDRLLAQLALDPRKVAIERNRAIVPRSAYAATTIEAGDAIEIVHFIGGG